MSIKWESMQTAPKDSPALLLLESKRRDIPESLVGYLNPRELTLYLGRWDRHARCWRPTVYGGPKRIHPICWAPVSLLPPDEMELRVFEAQAEVLSWPKWVRETAHFEGSRSEQWAGVNGCTVGSECATVCSDAARTPVPAEAEEE